MDGKNSNERKSGHAQQFTSMTSCALVSGGKTASQGDGKELKDRNMLGFAPLFGRVVFPRGRLPSTHPFSFKKTIAAPLAMPRASLRSYRTIEYHQLCTGGFNRICTRRGRVYWLAQNEHGHRTPDWKVHFSIRLDHLAVAWDVLAATFLDHACETGIKVCVGEALGRGRWPAGQRGREITLYMFTHAREFGSRGGPCVANLPPNEPRQPFWLSPEFERSGAFWRGVVRDAERRLRAHGVESRGCADGDLPLGRYASLRNEAFVRWTRGDRKRPGPQALPAPFVYPPNEAGWNAARHPLPPILADLWPMCTLPSRDPSPASVKRNL